MLRRIVLACGILAVLAFSAGGVHYLRWSDMQSLVPEVTSSKQWDSWVRQRDYEIRSGVDRYIEDSISTQIMFGTSFTPEPRLVSAADAVNAAGGLTPAARARMDAFIEGLDRMDDERFRSILQFLRRRQISQEELRAYLSGNLRRAALERSAHPHLHHMNVGSTLIEQALRALMNAGQSPARVRRIAVVGPGLDPDYDPDTYNLFALVESALSTGMAKPGSVEAIVFDINPWVLSHVRAVAANSGARDNARLRAEDLNIVTQTVDAAPGQGFDLMFMSTAPAENAVEQSLVLANLAQMMAGGGVLLTNSATSVPIPQEFEAINGLPEGILAYRRK